MGYLLIGFYLAIIGFGGYGWVCNIIELINCEVFNGLAIARAIGIFVAPLGAVLGYL